MTKDTLDKILSEGTVSGDISQYPELIKPILYKVYTESLAAEIGDLQPMKSPVTKIYTLFSSYSTSDTNSTNSNNSSIITLSKNNFVIGDTFITSTGSGEVIYSEDNKVLIKYNTGNFQLNQIVNGDNTIIIFDVITNRNYARRVFKNFTGPFSTSDGEKLTSIPEINQQLIDKTLEVKSRKIKSKITREVYDDMLNMFGEDLVKDILINEFSSEIIQGIDSEIISYLKQIATPSTDVILRNAYSVNGGDLGGVATDLYANMYKLTIDIMRNTKRYKNFFVLSDAATMGLIISSSLHVKPDDGDNQNSYYMGKIGGSYNLYLDPFSSDNYVLVGYRNSTEGIGDAGLIMGLYNDTITEAVEPETGMMSFFNTVRYDYISHPQDTTTGSSDSIFFKMFKVDLTELVNYVNISNDKR